MVPYLRRLVKKYMQAFFLLCMSVLIMSTQLSLSLFGAERVVYWRESRHYSVWSYVCGKELAVLPFTLLNPLALALFWYQLVRPSWHFPHQCPVHYCEHGADVGYPGCEA